MQEQEENRRREEEIRRREEEPLRRREEELLRCSMSGQEGRRDWRQERSRSRERLGRDLRTRSRSPRRRSTSRRGISGSLARRDRSRNPARRYRSPGRREREERREAGTRRTYSRSPRRARGGRRSRSRGSKRRSRSSDWSMRSRSPARIGDLREKLKEEGVKREMADLRRQIKTLQASNKDDYNYLKFALPGGGNEQQMKFVREVKQIMIYDFKTVLAQEFEDKIPPAFTAVVDKGEEIMNFRMKIIAFAEESTLGWKAANEFAILLKSSNDIDSKKQEEAEKRAYKKMEGEKKGRIKKTGGYERGGYVRGGYERVGDRGRRSRSRSVGGGRRSRSRSKPR